MGSLLISYGPLGTPHGTSTCPNGIARFTKVHLEVRQMHKSACGGAQSASGGAQSASGGGQMEVPAAQMAVLTALGRCPSGDKYVRAELTSPG